MYIRRVLKCGIIAFAICACLGGVALAMVLWQIRQSVDEHCGIAQQCHPHPDDDVAALVDFMKSDSHSLAERNRAIWTLGRLRDRSALPTLQAAYTGERCQHDTMLCQYELEKAIRLCGGTAEPLRKRWR